MLLFQLDELFQIYFSKFQWNKLCFVVKKNDYFKNKNYFFKKITSIITSFFSNRQCSSLFSKCLLCFLTKK